MAIADEIFEMSDDAKPYQVANCVYEVCAKLKEGKYDDNP
jgi:hypothetical protein